MHSTVGTRLSVVGERQQWRWNLGYCPACGKAKSSLVGVGGILKEAWEKEVLMRKDRYHERLWGYCP